MAIILFTAGLGYVTYLLAFSNRSRNEMGFLQSIGLSSRQLAGLLILEHSIIIAVGIGLGSGAGWLMSDLMVSSVAVTENGREVIPPFILETDFRVLVPMYFALIAIFALAVYRLTQSHAPSGLPRHIENGVICSTTILAFPHQWGRD